MTNQYLESLARLGVNEIPLRGSITLPRTNATLENYQAAGKVAGEALFSFLVERYIEIGHINPKDVDALFALYIESWRLKAQPVFNPSQDQIIAFRDSAWHEVNGRLNALAHGLATVNALLKNAGKPLAANVTNIGEHTARLRRALMSTTSETRH